MRRTIALLTALMLLFTQPGPAQVADLTGFACIAHQRAASHPASLRCLSVDAGFPRLFADKKTGGKAHKQEHEELTRYFLTGLVLPDSVFWVNLRPDAPDKVMDPVLERTEVGRIMLEADLQLKKDLAAMTSPSSREGKRYWELLYAKAGELYGTETRDLPTAARPWIVPGEIVFRESAADAYIYKANLEVRLEEDYLRPGSGREDRREIELNEYSCRLIREIILPGLTRAVNSSERYSTLRQVFHSLILAQWYKKRFGRDPLRRLPVPDCGRLEGLESRRPWSSQALFDKYRGSFQKGEYEEQETVLVQGKQAIRRYFSGGVELGRCLEADIHAGQGLLVTGRIPSGLLLGLEELDGGELIELDEKAVSLSGASDRAARSYAIQEISSYAGHDAVDIRRKALGILAREKPADFSPTAVDRLIDALYLDRGVPAEGAAGDPDGPGDLTRTDMLFNILNSISEGGVLDRGHLKRLIYYINCSEAKQQGTFAEAILKERAAAKVLNRALLEKPGMLDEETVEFWKRFKPADYQPYNDPFLQRVLIPRLQADAGMLKRIFPLLSSKECPGRLQSGLFALQDTKIGSDLLIYAAGMPDPLNEACGKAVFRLVMETVPEETAGEYYSFIRKHESGMLSMIEQLNGYGIDTPFDLLARAVIRKDGVFFELFDNAADEDILSDGRFRDFVRSLLGHEKSHRDFETTREILKLRFNMALLSLKTAERGGRVKDSREPQAWLNEYHQDKLSRKAFLKKMRAALVTMLVRKVARIDSDRIPLNRVEKIFFGNGEYNEQYWIPVLLYFLTKEDFPDAGEKAREVFVRFFQTGDRKELNSWLYKESPWNRDIYEGLLKAGYSPRFWEDGFRESYLIEADGSGKGLVRPERVWVEIGKDFFKDARGGMDVPGCFNPLTGSHKEMPLMHALEANSTFIRIYDREDRVIANAVLLLEPQGVMVHPLYNRSDIYLDRAVFRTLAALAQRGSLPAVFMEKSREPLRRDSCGLPEAWEYSFETERAFGKTRILRDDYYFDYPSLAGNEMLFRTASFFNRASLENAGFREGQHDPEPAGPDAREAPARKRQGTRMDKGRIRDELFSLNLDVNWGPILSNIELIMREEDGSSLELNLDKLKKRSFPAASAEDGDRAAARKTILAIKESFKNGVVYGSPRAEDNGDVKILNRSLPAGEVRHDGGQEYNDPQLFTDLDALMSQGGKDSVYAFKMKVVPARGEDVRLKTSEVNTCSALALTGKDRFGRRIIFLAHIFQDGLLASVDREKTYHITRGLPELFARHGFHDIEIKVLYDPGSSEMHIGDNDRSLYRNQEVTDLVARFSPFSSAEVRVTPGGMFITSTVRGSIKSGVQFLSWKISGERYFTSSEAAADKDGGGLSPGGIDFRELAPRTASNLFFPDTSPVSDPVKEVACLERMIASGTMPSATRMRDLIVSAVKDGNTAADELFACMAGLMRLEEMAGVKSDPVLRDSLALLELAGIN